MMEQNSARQASARATIEYIGSARESHSIIVPGELAGVRVRLQPRQATFDDLLENSPASWLGYGGSRGGAKSGACRRSMVRRRLQYPGTVGQIIRRVWEDVRLNHVEKFFEEFPGLLPYYRVAEHEVTIPTISAPSKIKFDSAETETDIKRKAYGPEFMDIFVDQAEQFSEKELVLLKTSNRWPGMPKHRCKFALFFNPGGVGAPFLRRVFHAHDYQENEHAEDFAYVQAYGWDNVEWCRDALETDGLTQDDFYRWTDAKRKTYFIERSQYGRELNALPLSMRLGHLEGSFDKFAGQYFAEYDQDATFIEHDQFLRLWGSQQSWAPVWISIDWGSTHHAYVAWHVFLKLPVITPPLEKPEPAMTPEARRAFVEAARQAERDRRGGVEQPAAADVRFTFREWLISGLGEEALAEEIIRRTPLSERQRVQHVFLSPECGFEDELQRGWRIGSVFARHNMPRAWPAFNPRIDGWRFMYEQLRDRVISKAFGQEQEYSLWCITSNCPKALEAIPLAVADPDKDGDVLKKGDDPILDVLDGLRYGIASYQRPEEKPAAVRKHEIIAPLPMGGPARLMAGIKFDLEERQNAQPYYTGNWHPSRRSRQH